MAENGTGPVAALNAALAEAQGKFPPISRDKQVTVTTKTGGKYSFSYAPLETILAACRPVLSEHGLALVQLLEDLGPGPAIRTELRHKDGGVVGASFPLPGTPESPQALGSLLTYLRRYAIVALLGIATEEDDDGQQAADTPTATKAPRKEKKAAEPPDRPADGEVPADPGDVELPGGPYAGWRIADAWTQDPVHVIKVSQEAKNPTVRVAAEMFVEQKRIEGEALPEALPF